MSAVVYGRRALSALACATAAGSPLPLGAGVCAVVWVAFVHAALVNATRTGAMTPEGCADLMVIMLIRGQLALCCRRAGLHLKRINMEEQILSMIRARGFRARRR